MKYNVCQDLQDLSQAAAAAVCQAARQCVAARGYFTLVLAGGSTPRLLYRTLAERPQHEQLPWHCVHVFWGDERFVPQDHSDSNYLMAQQTLLSRVDIPPGQVYRVPTETATPEQAAAGYETCIRAAMRGLGGADPELPILDLILLGVGADGHTASLFPGDPSLNEDRRWVCAARAPGGAPRLTMTLPVLNAARQVLFLAAGADKQKIIREIAALDQKNILRYPAQMVRGGNVAWLLDREAIGEAGPEQS